MERQKNEQDRYVLIVVDMQRNQKAANDPAILAAVCREIEEAKRRLLPIIVLELPDDDTRDRENEKARARGQKVAIGRCEVEHPTTLRPVMQLLQGYQHYAVRNKYDFSGMMEVLYACHDRGWPKTSFRLVGVYAFSCVLATAKDLRAQNPYVRLDAIQDACGYDPRFGANWWKFDGIAEVVPNEPEAA